MAVHGNKTLHGYDQLWVLICLYVDSTVPGSPFDEISSFLHRLWCLHYFNFLYFDHFTCTVPDTVTFTCDFLPSKTLFLRDDLHLKGNNPRPSVFFIILNSIESVVPGTTIKLILMAASAKQNTAREQKQELPYSTLRSW